MNTVYIEVRLDSGEVVSLNTAAIISIEPFQDEDAPATCIVSTGAGLYFVQETREALRARIDAIQAEARRDWWAQAKSFADKPDDERESPVIPPLLA